MLQRLQESPAHSCFGFLSSTTSNSLFNGSQFPLPQGIDINNVQAPQPVHDAEEIIIQGEDVEGAAGGDPQEDAAGEQPRNAPKRKRYHRHTAYQIQRLEETFNELPHPDDKQRKELSRELGLSPVQIKFWFQNKRTQIKNQNEREENQRLKDDNDKLLSENIRFKEALASAFCPTCSGTEPHGEMSFDEQQLRLENGRLREEIDRVSAIAAKLIGKPATPRPAFPDAGPSRLPPEFGLEGFSFQSGLPAAEAFGADALLKSLNCQLEVDKPFAVALAQVAMLELIEMAQRDEPLWNIGRGEEGSPQTLDEEEYARMFPGGLGLKMPGLKTEVSRETATIRMECNRLVDFFMDSNKWALLFSSIVSRGTTVQVYANGSGENYHDGLLQLMTAELQMPSPLVPLREGLFLRYCKRHPDGISAIVDVSLEVRHNPMTRYRKRPSGILIQELPNGCSKVIWVEHVEADHSAVHDLYKAAMDSGHAFGANRWVSTMARQCERLASLIDIKSSEPQFHANPGAMRNTLKLAEIMMSSFCSGISGSSAHHWTNVSGNGVDEVKIRSRKNNGMPGRPSGTVLSACISFRLPAEAKRIFDYLRSGTSRAEWDVLLQENEITETARIENSDQPGNCVSILAVGEAEKANKVMVLQETCFDESCYYVIYAPVDSATINSVYNGGDTDYVALMPSGFAIMPNGTPPPAPAPGAAPQEGTVPPDGNSVGGSLVTVGFQILIDSIPESKVSLGSVATVNSLVSGSCQRIKDIARRLDAQ